MTLQRIPFRGPLYQQVFAILRQRIVEGLYAPDDRLQTEEELAAEFEVSRATIRQAVGELAARGLVVRQQGKGTFVRWSPDPVSGQRFTGSLADLVPSEATIVDLEVTKDAVLPSRIASALGLAVPRGYVIRRTRAMRGELFAVTVNHLPEHIGSLMTEDELRLEDLMVLLNRKGIAISGAEQIIRAELADVDVCKWLKIDIGSPVLFAERALFGGEHRPVDLVQSWYRGDRYEYRAQLTAGLRAKGEDL